MANINIYINEIIQKVEKASERATFDAASKALADCNQFCKRDQSGLIKSSIAHSDLAAGKLVWKTPYARRQYYLDAARRTLNKKARKMWAHAAAAKHAQDWSAVYKASLKKEMCK